MAIKLRPTWEKVLFVSHLSGEIFHLLLFIFSPSAQASLFVIPGQGLMLLEVDSTFWTNKSRVNGVVC
jgi:hypothetical protein